MQHMGPNGLTLILKLCFSYDDGEYAIIEMDEGRVQWGEASTCPMHCAFDFTGMPMCIVGAQRKDSTSSNQLNSSGGNGACEAA